MSLQGTFDDLSSDTILKGIGLIINPEVSEVNNEHFYKQSKV